MNKSIALAFLGGVAFAAFLEYCWMVTDDLTESLGEPVAYKPRREDGKSDLPNNSRLPGDNTSGDEDIGTAEQAVLAAMRIVRRVQRMNPSPSDYKELME